MCATIAAKISDMPLKIKAIFRHGASPLEIV